MEDCNPSFLLYVLDPRGLEDVKASVERALGCTFHVLEADLPLEERQGQFEAEVLGIFISFRQSYSWPVGNVYRLSGSPKKNLVSLTGEEVSIDAHIARALDRAGLARALSREELGELRSQVNAASTPR